jgi:hypothetical protein
MATHTRGRLAAFSLVATLIPVASCSSSNGDPAATTTTTPEVTTTLPPGVATAIDDLLVGQCFTEIAEPAQRPFAVLVIPCENAHTHEVYDTSTFESDQPTGTGASYPGDLTVANRSEELCFAGFEAFIGNAWETSDYDIQAYWPTAESWRSRNDRTVICSAFKVNGGVTTGSVRNSGK